jgi:hypothetical protein
VVIARTVAREQVNAVPTNSVMNSGLRIAAFDLCIAAIASGTGNDARPGRTLTENASMTPATRPHPTAATRVAIEEILSIIGFPSRGFVVRFRPFRVTGGWTMRAGLEFMSDRPGRGGQLSGAWSRPLEVTRSAR